MVNLSINITERKRQDLNSDRGSGAHVCNSALSPDGVLFTVSSTLERTLAALAGLRNHPVICLHVKVFLSERGENVKKIIVYSLKIMRQRAKDFEQHKPHLLRCDD